MTQKNRSDLITQEGPILQDPTARLGLSPHITHVPRVPSEKVQQYLIDQCGSWPNGQCSTFRSIIALERMSRKRRVDTRPLRNLASMLLRKEVIQPHLPVRLPCYDFVLIASPTFDGSLHKG